MTKTTQIAQGAAHIAIASFTLAAPVLADEAPRGYPGIEQTDFASPTAVATEIRSIGSNDGGRNTAYQYQSYVTQLQAACALIDVRQNPALAALAANIAQLAQRVAPR